jgi:RNA polymerase sigma-70 factor, ECF subfamily
VTAPAVSDGCLALRSAAVEDLRWVFGLALRMTGHREEAEDLTQEVLARACERMDPRRSEPEKRAWLKRVMVNLLADRRRRQARLEVLPSEPESLDQLEASAPLPEMAALAHLTDGHVRLAITRLPRRFSDAVTLVDLEGFSYEQAAAQLNVRPGTVSSRVTRGRLHLRRELWELAAAEEIHTDTVCDAAAGMLRRYVDDETTPAEAAFITAHLTHCTRCQLAVGASQAREKQAGRHP